MLCMQCNVAKPISTVLDASRARSCRDSRQGSEAARKVRAIFDDPQIRAHVALLQIQLHPTGMYRVVEPHLRIVTGDFAEAAQRGRCRCERRGDDLAADRYSSGI
jgi:hypothetical protein